MINAHMATQPNNTKLWRYKGNHLALPFPVPSPLCRTDTAPAELHHLLHEAGEGKGLGRWNNR